MSRPPILKPVWAPETAGPVLTQLDEGAGAPISGPPCQPLSVRAKCRLHFLAAKQELADSAPTSPAYRQGPASSSRCPSALSLPDFDIADADLDFHLVALRKPHVGLTS